eukprot:111310-Chlamydomonas_euryale.AAC.3
MRARAQALGLPLHVLVLNASDARSSFALSPDGVEAQFMVNYLGAAALAQALLPALAHGARCLPPGTAHGMGPGSGGATEDAQGSEGFAAADATAGGG